MDTEVKKISSLINGYEKALAMRTDKKFIVIESIEQELKKLGPTATLIGKSFLEERHRSTIVRALHSESPFHKCSVAKKVAIVGNHAKVVGEIGEVSNSIRKELEAQSIGLGSEIYKIAQNNPFIESAALYVAGSVWLDQKVKENGIEITGFQSNPIFLTKADLQVMLSVVSQSTTPNSIIDKQEPIDDREYDD